MQTGHCTLGSKCNFAHSSVELREPETIDVLEPPPGLGLESMIGGLLSDDDEDSSEGSPGLQRTKIEDNLKPAYVKVSSMPDIFGASSISEESTDCEDGLAAFQEDPNIAFWDYKYQQLAAGSPIDFPLGELGCYPLEGNLPYGAWASPWAGGVMADQYTGSLFSNNFGPWD